MEPAPRAGQDQLGERSERPIGEGSERPVGEGSERPIGEGSERPIVLVHGAWAGEWCWERVVPLLRAAGRPVHTVSLRGHGRRAAESGPDVTLSDHVADLLDVLDGNDLRGVTLVGHSYGGRVITKAWPVSRARIAALVYLDAHAPVGRRDDSDAGAAYRRDEQGMIPLAAFEPDASVVGGTDALGAFHDRLMPQSPATLSEPFWVELPRALDRTYVHATAEPSPRFRTYAAAARSDPAWRYVEVPATHWLMFSHPAEVARIILDAGPSGEHESV